MADSLLQTLVKLLHREVPETVLERARLHLLDWLGCAVQGYGEIGNLLADGLSHSGVKVSSGDCRALFCGDVPWVSALQVNAGLGNVAEMDDVHRESTLHPGPVVIPVALAIAQLQGLTLRACLLAIIHGYEVAIRLGRTLGPTHYAHFHNTSTVGTPAAAASAAALLQLDAERTLWALSNACSRTGGLWQMRHEPVLTKQWHCIAAAVEGTLSAFLAQGGISGARSVLEGEQGLYAAMAPDAHPENLTQDSEAWLIEQTSFKPWPACRHAHATIDAARQALAQLSPDAQVTSARIWSYADAIKFCDNPNPQTDHEARFSLQHCVALVLTRRPIELQDFASDTPAFAQLTPLRTAVKVSDRDDFNRAYPQHYGSCVELTADDGTTCSASVADAWGDPEIPMSQDDLITKAHTLMRAGNLPETQARELQQWALFSDIDAPISEAALP